MTIIETLKLTTCALIGALALGGFSIWVLMVY